MLGAIVGDVIGSVHEFAAPKTKEFPLFHPDSTFTDDSVLTVAVAEWILTGESPLSRPLDDIRPDYRFTETCHGTVPPAVIAFLESTSYEDAIRNAISLGGDADTLACITGGIAEAFYGGVPIDLAERALQLLDPNLSRIVTRFRSRYGPRVPSGEAPSHGGRGA
jgi:ADP-ribosylglycohydrolase